MEMRKWLGQALQKEDRQLDNKHVKMGSKSFAIREM